jgi:hypothetical protein
MIVGARHRHTSASKGIRAAVAVLAVPVILCAALFPMHAQNEGEVPRIMLGFKAGYSQVAGSYAGDMENAPYLGAYVVPYSFRFVMAEADFSYSSFALKESGDSYLSASTFGLGPLLCYSPFRFIDLYAGISFTFSLLHLKAATLRRDERAYNAGFMLKGGALVPVRWGIGLRAGVEYLYTYISGKPFQCLNYYAAVSYNFGYLMQPGGGDAGSDARRLVRIERLYREGSESLEGGDVTTAGEKLAEVLSLDPGHAGARKMSELIAGKEETLRGANELIEQKQYYRAIPMLEEAGSLLPGARTRLEEVRSLLAPEVPAMEKEGIGAYEKKEYDRCINLMQRIRLIDPANRVVPIYLPRAQRRREALQLLK